MAGEVLATGLPQVTLARRMGLPWRTPMVIAFRCADCREVRTDGQGQILGVAFAESARWWWAPAVKHSMFYFDDSEAWTGALSLRPEAVRRLVDLDLEQLVAMNCRISGHAPRPKLSTWIRSRAVQALDDGYPTVHVAT